MNVICLSLIIFVYCLLPLAVNANNVTLQVNNQTDNPLKDAVISFYPKGAKPMLVANNKAVQIIDQVDKEFIAHVMPIQLGTEIQFPNYDQIRHHVYSFSAAKKFEIPLYEGMPAHPILFDKTGTVTIGCNIHDWMSAYIRVVDTPYFTSTNKIGQAFIKLPPGEYKVEYWHPDIDEEKENRVQLIKLKQDEHKDLSYQLHTKKRWTFRRSPSASNLMGRYR